MRRRRFLSGAAGCGMLAGCLGLRVGSRDDAPPTAPGSVAGTDLPVPVGETRQALPKDAIPAIVDPAFAADWSGVDAPTDVERPLLPDESPVVGVVRDGEARAYPLRILDWHEVVNDHFGGPLLVTYCPLCGSAVVAERTVTGRESTFGVSGKLWRDNLVLYDDLTGSLWGQIVAMAIRGPLTGEQLIVLPSQFTTWGTWRSDHPDGRVLLPPPASNTVRGPDATFDYFQAKYGYEDEPGVAGWVTDAGDRPGSLHAKELVLGINHDGAARAYPFAAVRASGVINDRVGDLPVVVTVAPGETLTAYVRDVDGVVPEFAPAGDTYLRGAGTRWNRTTGEAVAAGHRGERLVRANDRPPMFWRGWKNFHPDTSVYGT